MNWLMAVLTGYAWSHHTTGKRYGTKTPEEILHAREKEGRATNNNNNNNNNNNIEKKAHVNKPEK